MFRFIRRYAFFQSFILKNHLLSAFKSRLIIFETLLVAIHLSKTQYHFCGNIFESEQKCDLILNHKNRNKNILNLNFKFVNLKN